MGKKRKIATALKRVFTLALALMLTCSNLGNIRLFAAESHKLTVTGGTEGTDYKWDGKTLKVLTETSLTISGNNEETGWLLNRADPEEVIEINSGITSNITLSDATIYSNNDNSPIKVDSNATLNLTLQGTNTMNPQNGDEDGYPSIWVPQGANLVITKDSTGSLAASSYNGSAVIGGRTQDTENNCGNITINGGTLNLNAGSNAFYDSGAAIGSGKKSSFNSDIVINGGNITAKSSEGAAIGCGEYPDTKNKSDGTVTVNGGNIVAASGSSSDGIGVHKGRYKYDVKVTIAGGNVSSTANYVRPVNGNASVYKTEINIGAGISVSSLTVSINGTAYSYGMNDVTADSDGNIYAWLPNGAIVTGAAAVSGTDTVEYTGSINVKKNDKNTGSLIEKGTAGDFKIISCDSSCTYSYDKTSKVLTLSGNGNIEITLKSNVKVTDNRIVYANGAAVNLTINNVSISTTQDYAYPIQIKADAGACSLVLSGTNSLSTSINHSEYCAAAIFKNSGKSTLTIDGDGILNISDPYCCDGIGGDYSTNGIIINGGNININVNKGSAAIGYCTDWKDQSGSTDIVISGGKISAAGGGQGIGSKNKKGKVTISGGTIYASGNNQGIVNGDQFVVIDGGSINMGKQNNYFKDYKYPKNSSGNFVYLTEIQMGEDSTLAKNAKIDSIKITTSLRYTYNLKDVYTDNNGLLYFYLPEGTNITEVETEDAVYSGTITTNSIINKKRKLSNDYYDEYTIGTAFAVFNYAGAKSSMNLKTTDYTATYGDTVTIPVTFTGTKPEGMVVLAKDENGTVKIGSADVSSSTASLTIDTNKKELNIGDNSLYVIYTTKAGKTFSNEIKVTLNAKDVTVNFSCADKVYDGNSQIEITGEKIEGVIDADSEGVSINEVTASTLDPDVLMGENAAAAKTVILSDDVILTGSEAEWYTLNGITGLTAKITKKPITVKAGDVSVELNSEMPVSDSVTISGLVTDEDGTEISDLTGTLAFTFNPDTTGEATDAGSVTANGYLSNNYEISYESGVFTVTDPDPVMNVNGSYDVTYSDQLNIPVTFSKNATGIVKLFDEKDDIIAQADISSNAATLVYNTAEKKLNIGPHELTVYYMDSKDRTYTKNVKVTIAAKGISVNVSYVSRTYNGYKSVEIESAVLDTNDIVTVNSVVDDVTLSDYSAVTATLPSASAGKCTPAINGTFSITGNDAGFYELSGINSSSADIEKAPLKVSILNGVSVEQGAALPELTINDVTFEGFISYSDGSGSMINEGVSDLNGTLGFTFNPASTENAVTDGTVTPNGYTSNNYDIEYVGAEFIVTEKQEEPTEAPTAAPTEAPAEEPTAAPTEAPAEEPTAAPTETPAEEPTAAPTEAPAEEPTAAPTETPAEEPTAAPTETPAEEPTAAPTETPAEEPTAAPTETPAEEPTAAPTETPAEEPTAAPTETPAEEPTAAPTETPASEPTVAPTQEPTQIPTAAPTQVPVIIYPDITTIAPTTIAPTTASSTTVESTTVSLTSVPENTTSITTVTVLTEATTETSSTKVSTIDIPDEDNPMGKDDIDADSQPESTADNENPADIEITQEQNPQGSVKLPATGTAPASVYFVSGSVLLALGAFAILLANRRKEEKEDKE